MAVLAGWSDLFALASLALAVVAGIALWSQLPTEMAIHFDAGGTPDNYVSRPVGVLLAPAIGLVAVGIVRYAGRADPTADPRVLSLAVCFVGGLVAYVQGLVLAYNLGYGFSTTTALAPVIVAAAALVGYALYRDGGP